MLPAAGATAVCAAAPPTPPGDNQAGTERPSLLADTLRPLGDALQTMFRRRFLTRDNSLPPFHPEIEVALSILCKVAPPECATFGYPGYPASP